ncbi:fibronectin type 3 and ankyrin repeat domains protein 1-like [Haliotis asinina]|uniref:fibronectin type 3 and ankyrin repeat domains protein 1-like n=1 Tax=Haliotis asinina TaxID=109174 RepID=UPI003531ACA9
MMEILTVSVFSLMVICIRDVQAAPALPARVAVVESDMVTWKLKTVDLIASISALAERVELVFAEVGSLKASAQTMKIQLNTITQELQRVQRERDTYRKSLRKLRRYLNLRCCGIKKDTKKALVNESTLTTSSLPQVTVTTTTTVYPETKAASTDPSQKYTVSPVPVRTQDLQASTTDASEDLTPSTTAPLTPVTTPDSDHHATPSPAAGRDLYDASMRGDLGRVKRILAAGNVDINYRRWSWTPVMVAAIYGHSDVVEFLVGRGADVSLVDGDGDNVLHLACYDGDVETVKLILDLDVVDVNYRGHYSRTPVMAAAVNGHRDVVEFLVGRGADVSLVDRDGDNVLHLACYDGDVETVKLILDLNVVDVNARNNNGQTAAVYARLGGHQRVLDLLVSRGAR